MFVLAVSSQVFDEQAFINETLLVMYGKKLTIPGGSQGV